MRPGTAFELPTTNLVLRFSLMEFNNFQKLATERILA